MWTIFFRETEKTVGWLREKPWKGLHWDWMPGLQPHQRIANCSPEINLITPNQFKNLYFLFFSFNQNLKLHNHLTIETIECRHHFLVNDISWDGIGAEETNEKMEQIPSPFLIHKFCEACSQGSGFLPALPILSNVTMILLIREKIALDI